MSALERPIGLPVLTQQESPEANRFEILITDTQGSRSSDWFTKTGKAFATGVATACVVCAVIHEEVGMGAAHYNTITVSAFEDFYRKRSGRLNQVVSQENLRLVLSQTVNAALDEFGTIAKNGIPFEGTQVITIGVGYLKDPNRCKDLEDLARRVIGNHPREIDFISYLGTSGGILYGGKNHPRYNHPTIYNL